MFRYISCVLTFLNADDGPTTVEYAVMLALIIVACLASITVLGDYTDDVFDRVRDAL